MEAIDPIWTIFELSDLKINILLKRPFSYLSFAEVELRSFKDHQLFDVPIIMYWNETIDSV